ncbi:MAG TPA: acyltransferase [Candidatus Methylomirabilis sp.]|nr:acyltransferase [Candidatus Methylomirabilis sp.]
MSQIIDFEHGGEVDLSPDVFPKHVRAGKNVKIRRGTNLFGSPGRPIVMGDDIYVNSRCELHGGSAQLTLGNRVTLAVGVVIHTDSGPNTSPLLQKEYPITPGAVSIEDDVWIGDYAVIMPGVTIGHGSVVGAHSIVKANVDPHTVVARIVQDGKSFPIRALPAQRNVCSICRSEEGRR